MKQQCNNQNCTDYVKRALPYRIMIKFCFFVKNLVDNGCIVETSVEFSVRILCTAVTETLKYDLNHGFAWFSNAMCINII